MTSSLRNRLYRLGAIAISLAFFYFFPTLVAISYMSWNGFFSYDLFSEGARGITAFYWWAQFILITIAFYLTGSFYFVALKMIRKRLENTEKWMLGLAVPINLMFALGIFIPDWGIFHTYPPEAFIGMYIVAAWVMAHIAIIIYGNGKQSLYSIGLGAFLLCTVSIASPGSFALPYSLSLQFFGNGGNIKVSVNTSGEKIEGKLVLASPAFYYIQVQNRLRIVERRTAGTPIIENLSGFGH